MWLIAARAVQGVGSAILAPTTLAPLQTSFREARSARARSPYYAAVAGVAAPVGLVIGGMFVGWLSWRVGFFVNAPIGLAMMLAARRYLPETEPRPGRPTPSAPSPQRWGFPPWCSASSAPRTPDGATP